MRYVETSGERGIGTRCKLPFPGSVRRLVLAGMLARSSRAQPTSHRIVPNSHWNSFTSHSSQLRSSTSVVHSGNRDSRRIPSWWKAPPATGSAPRSSRDSAESSNPRLINSLFGFSLRPKEISAVKSEMHAVPRLRMCPRKVQRRLQRESIASLSLLNYFRGGGIWVVMLPICLNKMSIHLSQLCLFECAVRLVNAF